MNLTVRALTREDAAAIAALMADHPLWAGRDRAGQARALVRAMDRGEYGLVAEQIEEGRSVLVAFVIMSEGTFGEYGYVRLIGTRRECTGRGTGTRLLAEAEKLFVSRGIERVFLLCTESNHSAQSFYERHGYSRVGRLPDWLQSGVAELIYVRRDIQI